MAVKPFPNLSLTRFCDWRFSTFKRRKTRIVIRPVVDFKTEVFMNNSLNICRNNPTLINECCQFSNIDLTYAAYFW
jgi:hypothetical protein